MKKILHIAPDEKFIDMGLSSFEELYPNCNELLLITNSKVAKHVVFEKKELFSKSKFRKKSREKAFWKAVDVVVLHSLFFYDVVIPNHIKVIWLGFGFDYYDYILNSKLDYISYKTEKVLARQGFKEKAKKLVKALLVLKNRKQKIKLIERIDIFCPVLNIEYDAIKWPSKKKPVFMDWNYGTMEDNWAKFNSHKLCGKNILIGNSATPTCNHLDAIDALSRVTLNDSKLIIPLSYGNMSYANSVKKYANQSFQGEVITLEKFIPFDEYTEIISTCSFIIMSHKRQQGVGNVIMMLNLGAKVFLDKSNLLYTFLKEYGFFVFSLEEINDANFLVELNEEQKDTNKKLLFQLWGRESILCKTRKLVEYDLPKKINEITS